MSLLNGIVFTVAASKISAFTQLTFAIGELSWVFFFGGGQEDAYSEVMRSSRGSIEHLLLLWLFNTRIVRRQGSLTGGMWER